MKKFVVVGLSAAIVNILLMIFFVEVCYFQTSFLKNIANVLSMFLSIIYNFIFSRIWTWSDAYRKTGKALIVQFMAFNVVNLITMGFRIIVFAVLEKMGINYLYNVTIGMILATAISFVLYDKIVFNKKGRIA